MEKAIAQRSTPQIIALSEDANGATTTSLTYTEITPSRTIVDLDGLRALGIPAKEIMLLIHMGNSLAGQTTYGIIHIVAFNPDYTIKYDENVIDSECSMSPPIGGQTMMCKSGWADISGYDGLVTFVLWGKVTGGTGSYYGFSIVIR